MNLPKSQTNFFNTNKRTEALLFPIGVVGVVVFILILGFVIPKQKQSSNEANKKNTDKFTQTTTVKTADGKTQSVSPQVLQITADQLKAMIDNKQEVTLVQVVDGEGFSFPHLKGAKIINKKHFETSTAALDQQKTNILISKDGYDSAIAITKLVGFGFNRQKTLNLEGGLNSWQAKGYSIEK